VLLLPLASGLVFRVSAALDIPPQPAKATCGKVSYGHMPFPLCCLSRACGLWRMKAWNLLKVFAPSNKAITDMQSDKAGLFQ
jgi:hypothetical protein